MIVIILAAGSGSRLQPLTKNIPKCLVKYQNKPILKYQLEVFKKLNLKKLFLVSGYKSEKINIKQIKKVKNKKFKSTNMLYSLFQLKKLFNGKEDIIISYGDIIYRKSVLSKLLKTKAQLSTIVDKKWYSYWKKRMSKPLNDAESLILDKNNFITEIGKKVKTKKNIQGQYIGLTKISKSIAPELLNIWKNLCKQKRKIKKINNLYITDFFMILIRRKLKLKAIFINRGWLEFDTKKDLDIKF